MVKSLIRHTTVNAISLFSVSLIVAGLKIDGGITTFVFGGIALYFMTLIIRPILNILTLPLNLMTFGMFSFLTNVVVLYLLTIVIPEIKISSFTFPGMSLAGFIVPEINFNSFFAFVAVSVVLSSITGLIKWLMEK